jgi:hypothetical protein
MLGAVDSVVPYLVAKVPTEEASHLFRTGVLAVEETSRGEVVSTTTDGELLVGSQLLVRVVFYVTKTIEDVFSDAIF